MPPPNTPNEPSGASSPTSTRPPRTHAEPSRPTTRNFSSDSFVRDLETILAGPSSPAGSTSGSGTPSMSTTPISISAVEQQYPGLYFSQLYERSPPRRDARVVNSTMSASGWTSTYLPLQTPEDETDSQYPPDEANTAGNRTASGPRIDWQGLEYTGQVDDNLLCGICKTPYHKPLTTKACGHTFCEVCLYQALEEARGRSRNRAPCPLCRTELNVAGERGPRRFVRVVEMSAQLDQLEVKCPNNTQLCKWTGSRSSAERHVHHDCDYALIPCADSNCAKTIIRKSRGTACRHYEGPCAYCGEDIDLSTEVQHLMTVCPNYRASCGYCAKEVVRDQLAAHEEACSVELTTCSYSKLGCAFSSPRKDVLEHEKTCDRGAFMELVDGLEKRLKADMTEMKESLTTQMEQKIQLQKRQMDTKLQEIQEELQEERKKQEELAQKISRLQSTDLRLSRYRDPAASSATAGDATSEGRSSLPIPEDSDFEQAEYMFRMFDELDTRISNISKALIDQDARQSVRVMTELMPVKEQLVEARSQLGVMGMHVRWLMDLQRSRQRQATDVVGGLGGGGGAGSSSSSATTTTNGNAQSGSGQATSGSSGGGSVVAESSGGITRRVSDRVSPVRPSL